MKAEKDKKTGKWLIQYRYTDWQGKRRKSTKRGFATKREAEEWLRNFLITQNADFDMKFEEFWKMYCADMETRLREHTMRTKKYIVELKILPYFGKKRVNDITAADIRQWQNELIKKGYSPTYLKTINNQLSAIFNYAVRYYDLKSNPCAKAGSMGKSKAEEMDFWTGEEFRKFIDSVMNKRVSYMAFMTLYWTGMRLGELRGLMWKDIDFDNKVIHVQRTMRYFHGKGTVLDSPKTESSNRDIPMLDEVVRILKQHRTEQKKMKFYLGDKWKEDFPDLVFTSPWGKHVSDTAVNADMCRIEEKIRATGIEFEHIYPHVLRHTFATRGLEKGIPPKVMQELLGHTSITMTLDIYSHVLPDTKAKELEKIANLF